MQKNFLPGKRDLLIGKRDPRTLTYLFLWCLVVKIECLVVKIECLVVKIECLVVKIECPLTYLFLWCSAFCFLFCSGSRSSNFSSSSNTVVN